MRQVHPLDSAGVRGKTDLTQSQTRTWTLPLVGKRRLCFVLKEDASSTGLTSFTIQSRAHPDCDYVTVTPVLPSAQQTENAGGIGAIHAAAFSDAVVKANGYIVEIVSGLFQQDAGTFKTLNGFCGYPASDLKLVATVAGAGATVTGLELIVYEDADQPFHAG